VCMRTYVRVTYPKRERELIGVPSGDGVLHSHICILVLGPVHLCTQFCSLTLFLDKG
jgi:hypothetical protein